MNHRILAACGLSLLLPLAAAADNYRCTNGDLVRRIEILYEPGRAVPCQVHYFKDTEAPGTHDVLWTAQNEAGYCEARAAELADKLRGLGWACDAAMPAESSAPQEADDTEALTPGDEQR